MALIDELFNFIGKAEGFSQTRGAKAYLDPDRNTKNQYSVGYGHLITEADITRGYLLLENNGRVPVLGVGGKDTVITEPQARSLFNRDAGYYLSQTANTVGATTFNKLTDKQKTALVSYTYNAGAGSTQRGTGFAGFYNRYGFKEALTTGNFVLAGEILRDKGVRTADGVINQTLVRRRKQEGELLAGQALADSSPTTSYALLESVPLDQYLRSTYTLPLRQKYTQDDSVQTFATKLQSGQETGIYDTSLKAWLEQNAVYSESQLQGELALIRLAEEASATLVAEAKSNLSKVDGLIPAEAAFLIQSNLFELQPDLMRQQMSANAGSGENPNYSHAWRSPGKLAITADLTIPGKSGFRIGQIFRVGRTYDYKNQGAFQLFGLTEEVSMGKGWTTTIHSRFNAMPASKIQGLESE
jgi:GH24 family phage-related lysozyme (muramidase)